MIKWHIKTTWTEILLIEITWRWKNFNFYFYYNFYNCHKINRRKKKYSRKKIPSFSVADPASSASFVCFFVGVFFMFVSFDWECLVFSSHFLQNWTTHIVYYRNWSRKIQVWDKHLANQSRQRSQRIVKMIIIGSDLVVCRDGVLIWRTHTPSKMHFFFV